MNRVGLYIKEAINELVYKVSWPTWSELQRSAATVLVASVIFALIVWVMDRASDLTIGTYYQLFE